MRRKSQNNEMVLLESGFLLKEVFKDSYEYEAYFKLINSIDLNSYFPSELEIEFEKSGKSTRFKYPKDRPDVVVLVLPISGEIDSPKKRGELRNAAFQKYGGLIPKIRLEMKDELVMRKRLLVSEEEKVLIDKLIERERKLGIRRLKKSNEQKKK